MTLSVTAITERHLRLSLPSRIDLATQQLIHALDAFLLAQDWPDRVAQWPGYSDLLIEVRAGAATQALADRLQAGLQHWLEQQPTVTAASDSATNDTTDTFLIDMQCGEAQAPDLAHCAQHCGLSSADFLAQFLATTFTVGLLGFQPGFPYLLGLPAALQVPRRATPRAQVARGSVAIAGAQAGIYPEASPGGWNLIGQTSLRLFDPSRTPCSVLRPGMRVRFRCADDSQPRATSHEY